MSPITKKRVGSAVGDIVFPEHTLDLRSELIPAIRDLLERGLSRPFMKSCVRIGGYEDFTGGLKATLVGGLTVHVNAALKLGGPELRLHAALMRAVNARRPSTFAEVLDAVPLGPEGKRYLLLMGELRKHNTLFDLVYTRGTALALIGQVLKKTLDGLAALHTVRAGDILDLAGLPICPDPFTPRIRPKLLAAISADQDLSPLLHHPGLTQGIACPPVYELLERLEEWLREVLPTTPRVLVHGDPHLRNVLVRSYGKGVVARFIDPNPDYGYTDPAYDFGKMLHFAEPVGWALARPEICRADWTVEKSGWSLDANTCLAAQAPERRRDFLEREIHKHIACTAWHNEPTWEARLHVARASAHLGLLALFNTPDGVAAKRFILAHALAALAKWHSMVP